MSDTPRDEPPLPGYDADDDQPVPDVGANEPPLPGYDADEETEGPSRER